MLRIGWDKTDITAELGRGKNGVYTGDHCLKPYFPNLALDDTYDPFALQLEHKNHSDALDTAMQAGSLEPASICAAVQPTWDLIRKQEAAIKLKRKQVASRICKKRRKYARALNKPAQWKELTLQEISTPKARALRKNIEEERSHASLLRRMKRFSKAGTALRRQAQLPDPAPQSTGTGGVDAASYAAALRLHAQCPDSDDEEPTNNHDGDESEGSTTDSNEESGLQDIDPEEEPLAFLVEASQLLDLMFTAIRIPANGVLVIMIQDLGMVQSNVVGRFPVSGVNAHDLQLVLDAVTKTVSALSSGAGKWG